MAGERSVDVLILGGGLAGLALACQLHREAPDLSVAIVEKKTHPVPESAYKVGESTVPIGAHYLSEVLGLGEHLREEHLPKFGLRFFGSTNGNRDITERPEIGVRRPPPLPSFQLDRGRLENALGRRARDAGAQFITGARINNVELGEDRHTVSYVTDDGDGSVAGTWLVDASGRAALLKHKLGLGKDVAHDGNAAWFRIGDRIAVDDWSSDPEWRSRVPGDNRWLSTVHLHGPGYWVWLIPLASGSTSVGVVTDPNFIGFERIRRFDVLMEWMRETEPQLAAEIDQRSDDLQDFRTRKGYPLGCERVFSNDRWFITADAGFFHDPLYSPGIDYMSIANTMITRLIIDPATEEISKAQQIDMMDGMFRVQMEQLFGVYANQYRLFGHSEITAAKVVWDQITYFAIPAPLAVGARLVADGASFFMTVGPQLLTFAAISAAFQTFLGDWFDMSGETRTAGMMSARDAVMDGMQLRVGALRAEADVAPLLSESVLLLQRIFAEAVAHVATALGRTPPEDPDWTLDPERLLAFRLPELPEATGDTPAAPARDVTEWLCWATEAAPAGATNDHMSAWPRLLHDGPLPEPRPHSESSVASLAGA